MLQNIFLATLYFGSSKSYFVHVFFVVGSNILKTLDIILFPEFNLIKLVYPHKNMIFMQILLSMEGVQEISK
jgi:hypothetical protein